MCDEVENFVVFLTDDFDVGVADVEFDGFELGEFEHENGQICVDALVPFRDSTS